VPDPPLLAVVLPAYNEEGAIEATVEHVVGGLDRFGVRSVVVAVDDGSQDRTGAILDRLRSRVGARLLVVHNPTNRGYGGALRAGFNRALKAGADAIFYMDSDGQFDIADLGRLLPELGRYDALLGYRAHRRDPFVRRLNGWAWSQLISLVFLVRVRDVDCAFKLIRADFIAAADLQAEGAMISAELVARLAQAGLRVGKRPVSHYPRTSGQPTGGSLRVVLRAFAELVVLARRVRSTPPVRVEGRAPSFVFIPQAAESGP
jgi:glycosyltransferase involved in cell wall biosynthesis